MNKLIMPEQFAKEVHASMEEHGILRMLREASPEDREVMVALIANTFGAGFPIHPPASRKV